MIVQGTHKKMIVQPSSPEKTSSEKVVQFDVEKGDVEVSNRRRSSWFYRRGRNKMDDGEEPFIEVGTKELFQLNVPDWFLVIPGIVASAIMGVLFPTIAILFSGVLEVSGTGIGCLPLSPCVIAAL